MLLVQPVVNSDDLAKMGNGRICRDPEKIQANGKQDHINQTRNQDPFP